MFSKKIILGSSSPRRKKLIEDLGLPCEVRKVEVEEIFPANLSAESVPAFLAKLKAAPLRSTIKNGEILLTADTVVIENNEILHKPRNQQDASEMLLRLAGNHHTVVTGVCLCDKDKEHVFSSATTVYFKPLSEDEVNYYVQQFKPYDKAGGYGIQEWIGMVGIEKIEGSFYNVMGLPVDKVWEELKNNFELSV